MINGIVIFLFTFVLGVCFAPIVIFLSQKAKAGQNILHYVTAHQGKQGTPTLGGLIFLIPMTFSTLFFCNGQAGLAYVALAVTLSYGLLGFLDDFLKIKNHHNLGLRAYQKIIGQLGIAIIVGYYVWTSGLLGGVIYLPWGLNSVDIGWWVIPLVIFVLLAMTNSANLTDGLDGLAGWTSWVMLMACIAIISLVSVDYASNGSGQAILLELYNLRLIAFAGLGALLAFLLFNSYPAKIFMGDTGSLALGGLISVLLIFVRQTLLLPIICIVFVASAVSVILQVLHYKRTKKRIFLMAPLHHHLEQKGMNETKIVTIYIVVSIIFGTVGILLTLL